MITTEESDKLILQEANGKTSQNNSHTLKM